MSRNGRIAIAAAIIVVAAAAIIALQRTQTVERIELSPISPATAPISAPATLPAEAESPLDYVDLIRLKYPAFPATQPLGVPLDYSDAARVVLDVPIYLAPTNDLWITHPKAPPTGEVLAKAADQPLHVTRERVVFVFWSAAPDDSGNKWQAELIVRNDPARGEHSDAEFEHVNVAYRRPLPAAREFDFSRALQWSNRVVVPGASGVSVFDFSAEPISESFCELTGDAGAQHAAGAPSPQFAVDTRGGVLAWLPWENGKAGSSTIQRFVDGKWSPLQEDAGRIVQLVPLLDGSLLHIALGDDDDGAAQLSISALDQAQVDEEQVSQMVAQLSDPDEQARSAAFSELTRYGPGLWPVLEKLIDDQPPEAQVRLRQLLAGKLKPTLGGMTLIDGKMKLVSRQADGGALFYSEAGVRVPAADGGETFVVPAWLSCRPGRAIALLPAALVRDISPKSHALAAFGNEWILLDPVRGPRRFMGNHLLSLLKPDELEFKHVVGVDRRGRWIFQRPDRSCTLIVDPTLPDPTPRLPVWSMTIANGGTGWNNEDWPVIRRGGAWALESDGWVALDEATSPMITEIPPPPTTPTSGPVTTQTAIRALATDEHGCTFYGGRDSLRRIASDKSEHDWALPDNLVGSERYETVLIPADGSLFLFNQSGRVVQLIEKPEGFDVHGVFTRDIPNTDQPARVWKDPAGRINIVHDANQLHVLFPNGRIAASIRTLMPAGAESE